LQTNSTLQYEDGTLADVNSGVYNHHVQIFDIGKATESMFQCGPLKTGPVQSGMKMMGSYFGGSAADGAPSIFSTPDGSFNSGYYLSKSSKVIMSAELVNYAKEQKNIYAVTEVDFIPGSPAGIMDTTVGIMSVTQCDRLPNPFLRGPDSQKVFEFRSKGITATMDGYILQRRGHMHDGGTGMLFKINDKIVCNSTALYGSGQTLKGANGKEVDALIGMGECNEPVPIKRGDQIQIEAYFDLEKHPP
jgi:hypothetical protein